MKKWQTRLMAIIEKLGFSDAAKGKTLTAEEMAEIDSAYAQEYGTKLSDDRKADDDAFLTAEEISAIYSGLNAKREAEINALKASVENLTTENKDLNAKLTETTAVCDTLTSEVEEANRTIEALKKQPAPVAGVTVTPSNPTKMAYKHSSTALFGAEDVALYSLSKRHNRISATGSFPKESCSEDDVKGFMADFGIMRAAVATRRAELIESGQLSTLKTKDLIKGDAISYTDIHNTLGEYVTRRSDLILAYLSELPTVTNIFPVISNIQNKDAVPTAQFTELSQGYRSGANYKGSVSFGAEIAVVDDVMFKILFENMKTLETEYIGYLNREGSAPIKWTLIEWALIHFATALNNEHNIRAIRGRRTPQQSAVNPMATASDGVIAAIVRAVEAYKILPFSDCGLYSSTTMLDLIEKMWGKVVGLVDNIEAYRVYANAKHRTWYEALYRTKYGDNSDFTGNGSVGIAIAPESIIWVPYMSNDNYLTWIAEPGNICLLENTPMEMFDFKMSVDLESLKVGSFWKEGASVTMPGKTLTASTIAANNYAEQRVFVNNPIKTSFTIASTTDVTGNWLFELSNHATSSGDSAVAATDITTLSNVIPGRVYKFVAKAAGDTITKAGAFSKLDSAFLAGAAGDYIEVYAEIDSTNAATGKMLELKRSVTA